MANPKITTMSEQPSQKTVRQPVVRLGRSPVTGQYVLKPALQISKARSEKVRQAVQKVIASRGEGR